MRIRNHISVFLYKSIIICRDLGDLFVEADPEEFGDFLLDISEALTKNSRFEAALPFLEKLIHSEKYGEAAVWLQYADCLHGAGRLEQAEEAFRQVFRIRALFFARILIRLFS